MALCNFWKQRRILMYVESYSKCGSICSVVPPCSQGGLEMIGSGFCLRFFLFVFLTPFFVGHGVKGSALSTLVQSPARFFPELPCACHWCRCVRCQGDDTHSHQRSNKSHTDVWLCILLASTKGFCRITTRVSCGSREDMMYSSC